MKRSLRQAVPLLLVGCAIALSRPIVSPAAEKEPLVASYLVKGDLTGGEKALEAHLQKAPDDSEARYGLGIVQFLGGVERLSQSFYRHGLTAGDPESRGMIPLPFVRLDIPVNKNPEPIDYPKLRKILQQMVDDLAAADKTLSKIDDPEVKLRIPVGLIKLDLDGDGKASDEETFWRLFASVAGPGMRQPPRNRDVPAPAPPPAPPADNGDREPREQTEPQTDPPQVRVAEPDQPRELTTEEKEFEVAFDQADVHWFRGYTNVLRAMLEAYLAHDGEEFFDQTAHLYFAGAKPPYEFLRSGKQDEEDDARYVGRIADMIAAIHMMRFKPTEPERMKKAHQHLLTMIEHSRDCFAAAAKESDNDREWIPNPKQVSVVPMRVTEEQIAAWGDLLDEWEAMLEGKKLVPHWNIPGDGGINLKKVFHEPRDFDLVLWLHGAAAAPYIEKGDRTDPETWMRLNGAFRGNLFFVALWFN